MILSPEVADAAMVSFEPTTYTVTEGENPTADLMLVRGGNTDREVVVTVSTSPGTATGNPYLIASFLSS